MADDVSRSRQIIKKGVTVSSSLDADFVIEGCAGPINVGVVGTFVSPGASSAASYVLNEQAKTLPGGTCSVVCRSNAGRKLAIYDVSNYSELTSYSRGVNFRCSAPREEEVEVFDTCVYTYSGTI